MKGTKERGQREEVGVAGRGGMERLSHRPVAGAPRVGDISGAAVARRKAENGESEDGEEKRERIGEGDEGKRGKERSGIAAGRGGMESFPTGRWPALPA